MKKMFLFSAMAAGLLTSCVQTETIAPELTNEEKEITFQTVVAKQGTRALIDGQKYDASAPSFGTYAYHNVDGTMPGSVGYISDKEIVYQTQNDLKFWAPSGTDYYWPKEGSLTFYSYSPYNYQESAYNSTKLAPLAPEIGQYGFRFIDYDVDAHQETDLMVADIVYGLNANKTNGGYSGVPTVFRHKLALISGFVLTTSEDYDGSWDGTPGSAKAGDMRFKIRKITLKNIPTKGTFYSQGINGATEDIIAEKWIAPTSEQVTKDYVWYEDINGTEFGHVDSKKLHITKTATETTYNKNPTIDNGYLLVIPQTFGTGSEQALEIVYTIGTYDGTEWKITGEPYTKSILLSSVHSTQKNPDAGWDINKKITYTLDFSTTEIRWAPSVEEWADKDFTVDY